MVSLMPLPPLMRPTPAAGEGRELPPRTRQNICRLCEVSTILMHTVSQALHHAELLAVASRTARERVTSESSTNTFTVVRL